MKTYDVYCTALAVTTEHWRLQADEGLSDDEVWDLFNDTPENVVLAFMDEEISAEHDRNLLKIVRK